MALVSFSGFQLIQISLSCSRTEGIALTQAASRTGSASSTHKSFSRAFDLMLSRLWWSPMNL